MLTRTHAWSPAQKLLLVAAVIVCVAGFLSPVYTYERYYRGSDASVLFGTWQCTSGCQHPLYYQFGSNHDVRILSDEDSSVVLARGRWYAGGDFIYLRFLEPLPDSKRAILIYRIVDITPDQLQVRIWRDAEVRSYRRVSTPNASKQAVQLTASNGAAGIRALMSRFLAV